MGVLLFGGLILEISLDLIKEEKSGGGGGGGLRFENFLK